MAGWSRGSRAVNGPSGRRAGGMAAPGTGNESDSLYLYIYQIILYHISTSMRAEIVRSVGCTEQPGAFRWMPRPAGPDPGDRRRHTAHSPTSTLCNSDVVQLEILGPPVHDDVRPVPAVHPDLP